MPEEVIKLREYEWKVECAEYVEGTQKYFVFYMKTDEGAAITQGKSLKEAKARFVEALGCIWDDEEEGTKRAGCSKDACGPKNSRCGCSCR